MRVLDARADLYAIGVILYEALTGKLPFDDPDPYVMMRLHAKQPPPAMQDRVGHAAWCTLPMVRLVERALAKSPDERFASATEMTEALDAAFASIDHLG